MSNNIFFQWLIFQYLDAPKAILKAWRNFLLFNFNYFSIAVLFRTLFSYWHKYRWSRGRGFSIGEYLEVGFSNLISRVLGAIMRLFLIIIGLLAEILIFIGGLLALLFWLVLPLILIFGLLWSLRAI